MSTLFLGIALVLLILAALRVKAPLDLGAAGMAFFVASFLI